MAKFKAYNDPFVCGHCGKSVEPIKFGGSYRNHCPFCLWSKHVDADVPGDRANSCQGLMEPTSVFTRRTGEYVLVHHCTKCGFERYNRIAGDDDFDLVTRLSTNGVK
ncbi:RNHCP domain-containing protein [Candidatus Microgenomates bacterium]|nr:RNHCP domain-containing protein [Candidatus Microgenomates bacterium]